MNTSFDNSGSTVESAHPSSVPVPAAQRQAQDAPAGAPPSNTAPSNRMERDTDTLILHTGVDSLYLSYAGDLNPEKEKELEVLKHLAQAEDPLDRACAVYHAGDHQFEVKDKGKGRYAHVLQDGIFHLQLSRSSATSLPMVYAQISSEALTRTGVKYTEIALHNIASIFGVIRDQASVSRVDLCVDFFTAVDLSAVPKYAWINRAFKRSSHEDRGRFSGLTFGMGGAISARLYDKTLEIQRSEKTYFHDIWLEAGWQGESPVMRLEYQIKRQILREFSIRSVEELLAHRADLWAYCMQWLRLVTPSTTDASKERWPNHPLWDVLIEAPWGVERGEPLTRNRKTRPPSERSMFVNGIGAITSFMALAGISDFDEGLHLFGSAVHAYHRKESQRTGKTLSTYAREKIDEKSRRFNTAQATQQPAGEYE